MQAHINSGHQVVVWICKSWTTTIPDVDKQPCITVRTNVPLLYGWPEGHGSTYSRGVGKRQDRYLIGLEIGIYPRRKAKVTYYPVPAKDWLLWAKIVFLVSISEVWGPGASEDRRLQVSWAFEGCYPKSAEELMELWFTVLWETGGIQPPVQGIVRPHLDDYVPAWALSLRKDVACLEFSG